MGCEGSIRVEFQILQGARLLSKIKTMRELKSKYPKLFFLKYIYTDPVDGLLKGANPPKELPLVPNAYITVSGTIPEIERFAKEATTT